MIYLFIVTKIKNNYFILFLKYLNRNYINLIIYLTIIHYFQAVIFTV